MTKFAVWIATLVVGAVAATTTFGQTVQTSENPAFVCTGFGEEERSDPRFEAFPVKLIFATASGDFYANVDVTITDDAGAEVFRAHCDGPWLLVVLPSGTYRVTARAANGETVKARLAVPGQGQVSLALRFPGITE